MSPFIPISGAALAAAIGLHLFGAARFRRQAARLARTLETGPPTSDARPPAQLGAAALRNGAGRDGPIRAVRLTQEAEFRLGPDKPWRPMPATQTIGLGATGFVWHARQPGPLLPTMGVIDSFVEGRGLLSAALLGSIPVARMTGPVADRAEAMRYLAEIAWVPDAIIGNPQIVWTQEEDGFGATLPLSPDPVAVHIDVDADGQITGIVADRPDTAADGSIILRRWRGQFRDHAEIGGRHIPRSGEVGYVDDDGYAPYWRGRITGYQILK